MTRGLQNKFVVGRSLYHFCTSDMKDHFAPQCSRKYLVSSVGRDVCPAHV